MAGAYVFPGGRVDDADRRPSPGDVPGPSRFRDLSPAEEWAYRTAAARELREEAGLDVRQRDLEPFAHWVTPEEEPRRYDTRFFAVRLPEGQTARHDEGEATAMAWLSPADALARCEAGEIMLPPPTWTTLKQLRRSATVDDVLAWARATRIVRVQPGLIREKGRTVLTLPGDPLHPGPSEWEVPEDTRFELREGGGWRPARV